MIDQYTMIRALMRVMVAKGVATEDEIFAEAEAYRREMDAIQEQLGGFIARQNRCKACQGDGQLSTIDDGLADCWACNGSGRKRA